MARVPERLTYLAVDVPWMMGALDAIAEAVDAAAEFERAEQSSPQGRDTVG